MSSVRLGARASTAPRTIFGSQYCRPPTLYIPLLALAASLIVILPATAAELIDYEWDPSGVFTRTMRENASSNALNERVPPPAAARSAVPNRTRAHRRTGKPLVEIRKSARSTSTVRHKGRNGRRPGIRVASLGRDPIVPAPQKSLSGGGAGRIVWQASSSCLNSSLRSVIAAVAANYGRVRVNSTCRSRKHNRRVGGAPKSYHLTGDAADIRIMGNWRAASAYMRSAVGGFKHYGGGLFHIDTGPRRRF